MRPDRFTVRRFAEEERPMNIRFDRGKLSELMRDFYTLTGMRLVVFDSEFGVVSAWPEKECDFCAAMKRNGKARSLCETCDRDACLRCREEGGIRLYECHAGLTEAVSPLRAGDISLGYLMIGQILDEDVKRTRRGELTAYAGQYLDDAEGLLDRLTVKQGEQIRAAAKLMETCACYLWVSELVKVDDGNLIFRLSDYIAENLTADLTADVLCSHFGVSRSRLYRMSEEYFGEGIASYVRKKRIRKAAELLKGGESVARAAAAVGIADYNYFSKLFKRETGVLPGQVRRGQEL